MTGARRRLGAIGSAARRRACAWASNAISVSALASTMMSPGVCPRSTAVLPSLMMPGSVASRCTSRLRHQHRRDRDAVQPLAADHDEPALPELAIKPGPVEMPRDAIANRLHDMPAVAAGNVEKALDPEHVMATD